MNDSDLGASHHDDAAPDATPGVTPDHTTGLPGLPLAWRAPLLAYGVTLGASLVLGVLTLLALASGDAPSEVDDVSDATEGALAWLAIPFQLCAMALGGRVGFGDDDFTVSLLAMPLALTATYVVVLARFASASEARLPSGSRQARALTSGVAALGAAVVIALATRLLALRADGTSIHALSVSLVIGTLLLTFCADLVGRELRAVGLPAFVRTWSAPAIVWISHVGVWLVVSLPVLFVLAWVQEGFRVALSVPLWWPTGGLWTYSLGHLSGVGTSGFYSYAWSNGGVLTPVALLLGAALATTFASVVWHLRGRRSRAELARPASWAPLPVAFAVGGVLVTVVSMVSIGGGAYGLSGSFTIMPAAWTCLLLGLWGLAAEALSRSVAPQLAGMLPASLVSRLSGPAPAGGGAGDEVELDAPDPMTPEQARKVRRIAIVVGVGVAAVVAVAVAVSVIGSTYFTPERAAEDYVAALADGDMETVGDLVADSGEDASRALLTEDVYEAATDRPSGYTIGEVAAFGDDATVTVTADDGVGGESYLSLEKGDKKFGIFQEWDVTEGLTSSLSIASDTDEIAVNGVTVDAPDGGYGSFTVLPGTYTVDPYPGNEWLEGAASEVAVPLGEFASPEFDSPQPSAAFKEQVDAQVGAWLDECLASTEPDPDGCPQSAYTYGDVRNLAWELTESPTVDYEYFDTSFPMTLYVSNGRASVSYEVDESYGFGAKEWVEETDESSLDFSIEVDVVGDELEVTADGY